MTGPATEAIQVSREELSRSVRDLRNLYICGPLALESLMVAQGAKYEQVSFLRWHRASKDGTNLKEIGQLADRAKFPYRLIFRKQGQSVPIPAIVHWKVGHFAAIVGQTNEEARAIGFRPCKRCKPDGPSLDEEASNLVAKACRLIEGNREGEPQILSHQNSLKRPPIRLCAEQQALSEHRPRPSNNDLPFVQVSTTESKRLT